MGSPVTENKRETPNATSGYDDLFGKINQITELEKKILDLKKKLLMDTAVGSIDEHFEHPSFLLIRSGNRTFAAPLKYVDEIVEMPMVQPLPKPVPTIAGMVNYHGELIAIIDVEELTSSTHEPISSSQVLAVCTTDERQFGLKIDEALEVITVEPSAITMTDEVLPGIVRSSGMVNINEHETALILDIMWIAVGVHLGSILVKDAATPKE